MILKEEVSKKSIDLKKRWIFGRVKIIIILEQVTI